MKTLTIGKRVLITAGIPAFWNRPGRIVQILEPSVREEVKLDCLFEMPLYYVRLDDGRRFRFRGRDLEPIN